MVLDDFADATCVEEGDADDEGGSHAALLPAELWAHHPMGTALGVTVVVMLRGSAMRAQPLVTGHSQRAIAQGLGVAVGISVGAAALGWRMNSAMGSHLTA